MTLPPLYAYNAAMLRNSNSVGILSEIDPGPKYWEHLAVAFPDKYRFRYVPWLPIWVKDLYPVWHQWQCLHTHGQFNLAPWELPRQIDFKHVYQVGVGKLSKVANPFRLAPWLWGCGAFKPEDVMSPGVREAQWEYHSKHCLLTWHGEAARILYLVEHKATDPIIICTDYTVGENVMIEEGNHRFAAAMVRGDKSINAVLVGDMKILRKYLI